MKVYVAGPMRGRVNFNFPLFNAVTKQLREQGHEVFNPAERDIEKYGECLVNKAGSIEQAADEHGFSLNEALEADMIWICRNAEVVALLPGWRNSKGAKAEKALAEALGLEIKFLKKTKKGFTF